MSYSPTKIAGYPVPIEEVIKSYVKQMYFDGDESKCPDPENFTFYLDPFERVFVLNLEIPECLAKPT